MLVPYFVSNKKDICERMYSCGISNRFPSEEYTLSQSLHAAPFQCFDFLNDLTQRMKNICSSQRSAVSWLISPWRLGKYCIVSSRIKSFSLKVVMTFDICEKMQRKCSSRTIPLFNRKSHALHVTASKSGYCGAKEEAASDGHVIL
jgi:hypothetical protein